MKYKIFPNSLSLAMTNVYRWILFLLYISICLTCSLAIISFNQFDTSLLFISSEPTTNYLGNFGSYISSFIIYCFGSFSVFIPLFFFVASLHQIFKSYLKFIFLRFFAFVISIILIEQISIFYNYQMNIFGEDFMWGVPGILLSNLLSNEYSVIFIFLIGFTGIIFSIDLFSLLKFKFTYKIPKFAFTKSVEPKISMKKSEPKVSKKIASNFIKLNDKENQLPIRGPIYSKPSLDILNNAKASNNEKVNKDVLKEDANFIEGIFTDFNIKIEVINIKVGPVITLYEVLPAPGIKINSIINLADDISRSMGATSVRIAQVYGTKFIGIEIPNKQREMVTIKELLGSNEFTKSAYKIPICIGKDITGNTEVVDLSKFPHLLVAGTTGSGKSVFINSLLTSLLYKFEPNELRLILIDPKMIELSVYNDIPHLLTPVVTEPRKSIIALKWVCNEMERRYQLMNEVGCRSLENFNDQTDEKIPFIVIVIDEMADLMMTAGKEVEHYVQRLAQKARACGIHLVMATQRPSVDIITGSIKANFPSRISFQVASKYDSRTILGEVGAEQLLGNGDMLMVKNGSSIIRYQSGFMSDKEVQKMITEIKSNHATQYVEEIGRILESDGLEEAGPQISDEDEALVTKSIDLIKDSGRASTSYLQRNFQIGYNKAARIMEVLEDRGVVSKPNHNGKREILITT
jgi:DNA segregation ATPase FtsK/SpoIIIE, S-DNA-T family